MENTDILLLAASLALSGCSIAFEIYYQQILCFARLFQRIGACGIVPVSSWCFGIRLRILRIGHWLVEQ